LEKIQSLSSLQTSESAAGSLRVLGTLTRVGLVDAGPFFFWDLLSLVDGCRTGPYLKRGGLSLSLPAASAISRTKAVMHMPKIENQNILAILKLRVNG
jgi:hypothetical protein